MQKTNPNPNSAEVAERIMALAALLIGVAVVASVCAGCGASTTELAAQSAQAMHEIQVQTGPAIRRLRSEAMVRAGTRVHDAGGTEEAAHAAVDAEAAKWECAVDGHQLYSLGVGSFIDALYIAQIQHRDFDVADILPYVLRAAQSYRSLERCLRSLGSDALPETPRFLTLLPPAWRADLGARAPSDSDESEEP